MNPQTGQHLARLLGMIGSAHDNEALTAARMADRFVRELGLRWPDVFFVAPQWQHMAKACREHIHVLSDREADFIQSIARLRRMPTDRQLAWLRLIYKRIGGAV